MLSNLGDSHRALMGLKAVLRRFCLGDILNPEKKKKKNTEELDPKRGIPDKFRDPDYIPEKKKKNTEELDPKRGIPDKLRDPDLIPEKKKKNTEELDPKRGIPDKFRDPDLNLEKIPTEFKDPLTSKPMKDPVVLPSGAIMDRAVIRNHISKLQIDPFTGDHLTEDMLVSDDNLKARIHEFISGMDPNDTTGAINKINYPRRAEWDIDLSNVEIPMEFRDALENTLMREPVVLPSGRTVDRLVIHDHICESRVDPFSGRYLTENMLVPDNDLEEKISKFASSIRQGMQIAEYRQRKNAEYLQRKKADQPLLVRV